MNDRIVNHFHAEWRTWLASFLGLALGLSAGMAYVKSDGYTYKCCEYICFLFRGTIVDPNAFWTALASIVGVIVLFFIKAQLVETQHATEQTKRSVDAYISSERGRIYFAREAFSSSNDGMLHCFAFVNGGRTTAVITEFERTFDIIPLEATVPRWDPRPLKYYHIPIAPGGRIGTGDGPEGVDGNEFYKISRCVTTGIRPSAMMQSTHCFLTQFHIVFYTTLDTAYRVRVTVRTPLYERRDRTFEVGQEFNGEVEVPRNFRTPLQNTEG